MPPVGTGVTNPKCLACHGAVSTRGGSRPTFGGKRCIVCHTEHKGRSYNIIDLEAGLGPRDTFKARSDRLRLRQLSYAAGGPAPVHVRRLKTGRLSYLGFPRMQSCTRGHRLKRRAEQSATVPPARGRPSRTGCSQLKLHPSPRHLPGGQAHRHSRCTKCHCGWPAGRTGRAAWLPPTATSRPPGDGSDR